MKGEILLPKEDKEALRADLVSAHYAINVISFSPPSPLSQLRPIFTQLEQVLQEVGIQMPKTSTSHERGKEPSSHDKKRILTKVLRDSRRDDGRQANRDRSRSPMYSGWNSTYIMLESYVPQHKEVKSVLYLMDEKDLTIKDAAVEHLKKTMATLKPFFLTL